MKWLWQRGDSPQRAAPTVEVPAPTSEYPTRLGSVGLTYAVSTLVHQHGRATRADAKLLGSTAMAVALVGGVLVLDLGALTLPALVLGAGAVLVGAVGLLPVSMHGFPGIADLREQSSGTLAEDKVMWWLADAVSEASDATEARIARKLRCFSASLALSVAALGVVATLHLWPGTPRQSSEVATATPAAPYVTPTIAPVLVDLELQPRPDR